MTIDQAKSFVQKHGVVLASGKGPVPRLTEAIVSEPIAGSWWSHPKAHQIFAVLQAVVESRDVLVCRLVGGKVSLVHRRLWPALVRAAGSDSSGGGSCRRSLCWTESSAISSSWEDAWVTPRGRRGSCRGRSTVSSEKITTEDAWPTLFLS